MIEPESSPIREGGQPVRTKAVAGVASPEPPFRPMPVERRLRAHGKFLFDGDEKVFIKGVTYGPFRPDVEGCEYGSPERVATDFAAMAEIGINAVRTYTPPPRWMLDVAAQNGLRVMVGLPWEQHVAFLDDAAITRRIEAQVARDVRSCAGHPAVFCYAIGNEIPSPIARWHGQARVERFLKRLERIARAEDEDALFTYVNYPSTEYLRTPSTDLDCFNVYLESQDRLAEYLLHLQNVAGDRPLLLAEVGLDSVRNGEAIQADTLRWQLETVFGSAAAGTFVFSWTDEWHRGGFDIEDWGFGLTTRDRTPKLALETVRAVFRDPVGSVLEADPFISVVLCSYNGASTIRETLEALAKINYDTYEVIVVNDGSTDATPDIIGEFDVERIDIPNGGLSNARNVGLHRAKGEIVAYIDDDAYPDQDWLRYLAIAFRTTDHVGVGGPNLPPPDDGAVADCVANSPGGPSHVLFENLDAEHVPGCNMAFRRAALMEIDGFDVGFRIAGDDVDLCWRLQEAGGTLGFAPGAVVWHHRRGSVSGYLRQQLNYGRAEGMLESKWPGKYNRLGHLRWGGRLYGQGHTRPLAFRTRRVDQGVWGSRLFQSMYATDFDTVWSLTLMPEWYLFVFVLAALCGLGIVWSPLLWGLPLLAFAVVAPFAQVVLSVARGRYTTPAGLLVRFGQRLLTASLHMAQPLSRLVGRIEGKLTPWRRYGTNGPTLPRSRTFTHWSEGWQSQITWLERLERNLHEHRVPVRRGGGVERWDIHTSCGLLGAARLLSTVEEHGAGKQLIRVRVWPRMTRTAMILIPLFLALCIVAALDGAWGAFAVLAFVNLGVSLRSAYECGTAIHSIGTAVEEWQENPA
ncbi:MAG: glycosyl transferase [Planctomycetes bacterium]|nr:glycosyl transferase [Planctomycetota bacterium]